MAMPHATMPTSTWAAPPHAAFAAMLQGRLPEGPSLLDLILA